MQPHHHHHHLLHYYYYSINNFRPDPTRWTHIHQWSQNNPHHQIRAHTHCHYKSHRFQIYFSCNNNNSKALCFLLVFYETALEIDPNQFQDSKSLISIKIPIWVSGFLTDFLPHGSKRLLSFHTHAHTERERNSSVISFQSGLVRLGQAWFRLDSGSKFIEFKLFVIPMILVRSLTNKNHRNLFIYFIFQIKKTYTVVC